MKYLHVAIGVGWSQDVRVTEVIVMGVWSPAAPPGTTEIHPLKYNLYKKQNSLCYGAL